MAFIPADSPDAERFREMFGPQQVDQTIRQAITMCWMGLPRERRSVGEVEAAIRRLVDRALRDLREDAGQFGFPA